jgi:FixJ family two-component response regulator
MVHVVDDDPSMRTALARLLRSAGFEARAYASAAEFLVADVDASEGPGCVVLDVKLPGMSGMELQAALTRRQRSLPIVFLTGRGDIDTSVQAMKAGAVDFLTKPVRRGPLLAAIQAALARDAAERDRLQRERDLKDRYTALTAREREVLARVVAGMLNKQIADQLGVAIRTVKAHRAQVMAKMQAASLADLVHMADQLAVSPPARRTAPP